MSGARFAAPLEPKTSFRGFNRLRGQRRLRAEGVETSGAKDRIWQVSNHRLISMKTSVRLLSTLARDQSSRVASAGRKTAR